MMMQSDYVIRKASTYDVPQIVELWKELMDFHKERDRIFSRSVTGHVAFADFVTGHISNETSCVFVAEAGRNLVGYCLAFIEKYPPVLKMTEYGLVQDLGVTKKYQRRAIGKRLLKKAQNWFSEKGVRRIEARVAEFNKASTESWAKMGFTPYLETVFMEIQQDL
jgi:ribosomal protein S18 acetylase RimI-like enzyme